MVSRKHTYTFMVLIVLYCLIVLNGCNNSSEDIKDDTTLVKNEDKKTSLDSDNTSDEKLEKPTNLKTDYFMGKLTVSWNPVEGASYYQLLLNDSKHLSATEPSTEIFGLPEGEECTIKIRASKSNGFLEEIYSDWAEIKSEIPVTVSSPQNVEFDPDGKGLHISWNPVDKATKYVVRCGGLSFNSYEPKYTLSSLEKGKTYSISVSAVVQVGDKEYSSVLDKNYKYTLPELDYTTLNYRGATLLDYDALLEWAKYKKYSSKVTTEGNLTVVDIYHEDTENKGWIKSGWRILKSGVKNWWESGTQAMDNKVKEDFESIKSTITTILSNDGIDEYLESVGKEGDQQGAIGFFFGIIDAVFADTNIHHKYYFQDKDKGALFSQTMMLVQSRKDYEKTEFGDYPKSEDGYYNLQNTNTKQVYKVYLNTMTLNSMDFWFITVENCRKR